MSFVTMFQGLITENSKGKNTLITVVSILTGWILFSISFFVIVWRWYDSLSEIKKSRL